MLKTFSKLQVIISVSDYMMLKIRGYDYDGNNDCIVEWKDNGQFDRCRPLINCKMCSNVSQIDVIDANNMNRGKSLLES